MKGLRIDICLRQFLETFRLPGEAPVISFILEHFADRYYVSTSRISSFPFVRYDVPHAELFN